MGVCPAHRYKIRMLASGAGAGESQLIVFQDLLRRWESSISEMRSRPRRGRRGSDSSWPARLTPKQPGTPELTILEKGVAMSGSTAGGYGRDSAAIESTGRNLAEILHGSVCEALHRLDAVAAAVYLLNAGHTELKVGTIVGSPPSFFAFPGHINIDAPFASARALTSVNGAVCDPDPVDAEELGPRPSPYVALAVPVGKGSQRFGTLTVLRLDTHGAYESGDCTALQEVAETLADALADLSASGTAITAGPAPILLPTYEASWTARVGGFPTSPVRPA